jgi:tetratricopeptide (TPR) repeat protein
MTGWWLRCGRVLLVLAAVFAAGGAVSSRAQPADEAEALNHEMFRLSQAGKYKEAAEVEERELALRERQAGGPDDPGVGLALNNLANIYRKLGRYTEAESLWKRSLAIREKAFGPEHPNVATALNNLALLYTDLNRHAEAEPLYQRSLAIREKVLGPDSPEVGLLLNNLALLYFYEGRYAGAEPLYQRSLAVREKALGPNHRDVGQTVLNLAQLYKSQDRFAEAERLYQRGLTIYVKSLGPDHPDVAVAQTKLADLYLNQARYAEAERLYQRSLTIREKSLGPDHPEVSNVLNDLGRLYATLGRYVEAEPLHRRSLAISEKTFGPDHPNVAVNLLNLAALLRRQHRYGEAEPLYKRSLTIYEKALGPDHPYVAGALANLGAMYWDQRRYAEAEPLYQRSLAIREKGLGPQHSEVANVLNLLGLLYVREGRYGEAEPLHQRSLAISEAALGQDAPSVAAMLNNLAIVYFDQHDWTRAAEFWRRSTRVLTRSAERGTQDAGELPTGTANVDSDQPRPQFWQLVKAVNQIAAEDPSAAAGLSRETFRTAQWAQGSEAARSLAQMAARSAATDPALAALVRERQDLVVEWQARDVKRNIAVAQAPDKRDRPAEAANTDRMAAIDSRVAEIDKRLAADFPNFASLASPTPLSVEDVQARLGADEALVLFLDTPGTKPIPEETFVWVVTRTEMRWVRSELGTAALTREVAALRCGLDFEAWIGPRCANLLKVGYSAIGQAFGAPLLPFDLERAHALYRALFGQVEDLIKDKQLLVVPSGPLVQLPFQVLVTEPSKAARAVSLADYRNVAWFVRKHAVTVLPAVSSLKALRDFAKASRASEPFVGFGNPLLDGDPMNDAA